MSKPSSRTQSRWTIIILGALMACSTRQQLGRSDGDAGIWEDDSEDQDAATSDLGTGGATVPTSPADKLGGSGVTSGLGGATNVGGVTSFEVGGVANFGGAASLGGGGVANVGGGTSPGSGGIANGGSVVSLGGGGVTNGGSSVGGSSVGGTSALSGFGGLPYSGYCVGTDPKIQISGKDLVPTVTQYAPSADLVDAYGLSFSTSAALGYDLHLEIIGRTCAGNGNVELCYCYPDTPDRPQVKLIRTGESPAVGAIQGTVRFDSDPTGTWRYAFGICVEVVDKSSELLGAKVFVPSPYPGVRYY